MQICIAEFQAIVVHSALEYPAAFYRKHLITVECVDAAQELELIA